MISKLCIITICLSLNLLGQNISSDNFGCLENGLSGTYFQFFSVTGMNATPENVYLFLDQYQKSHQEDWDKKTYDIFGSNFSYCIRKKKESGIDIITMPFQIGENYHFLSLDEGFHMSFNNHEALSLNNIPLHKLTSCFLNKIFELYSSATIHILLLRESIPISMKKNKTFNRFVPESFYRTGHCQYAVMDRNNFLIFEPGWLRGEELKTKVNNLQSTTFPMWSQITNGHDCVRFSIIYLLYALQGISPNTLSNMQIYIGFKNWIEGENGFNSFQLSGVNEESNNTKLLKQSKMSYATGFWRTIVDHALQYNLTKEFFILGIAVSYGIIYLFNE